MKNLVNKMLGLLCNAIEYQKLCPILLRIITSDGNQSLSILKADI